MKKYREEKGSVTLFVLIAMIFFIGIVFNGYMMTQNKLIAVNKDYEQLKAGYESNLSDEELEQKYEELTASNLTATFNPNGGTIEMGESYNKIQK